MAVSSLSSFRGPAASLLISVLTSPPKRFAPYLLQRQHMIIDDSLDRQIDCWIGSTQTRHSPRKPQQRLEIGPKRRGGGDEWLWRLSPLAAIKGSCVCLHSRQQGFSAWASSKPCSTQQLQHTNPGCKHASYSFVVFMI